MGVGSTRAVRWDFWDVCHTTVTFPYESGCRVVRLGVSAADTPPVRMG